MSLSDFSEVDFGDHRINKRRQRILESFFQKPGASINGVFEDGTNQKPVIDFFDNEKIIPGQILKPHKDATLKRLQDQDIIYRTYDCKLENLIPELFRKNLS